MFDKGHYSAIRLIASAFAASALAASALVATSATASAGSNSVTVTTSASPGRIQITINNNLSKTVECAYWGYPKGTSDPRKTVSFSAGIGAAFTGGSMSPFSILNNRSAVNTYRSLNAGTYILQWACAAGSSADLEWGTPLAIGQYSTAAAPEITVAAATTTSSPATTSSPPTTSSPTTTSGSALTFGSS